MMASSSSKWRSLISSFFIWVSTSRATSDLILRSSTAARCLALTAAAPRAAAAAVDSCASFTRRSLSVSGALGSSVSMASGSPSLGASSGAALPFSSAAASPPEAAPSTDAAEFSSELLGFSTLTSAEREGSVPSLPSSAFSDSSPVVATAAAVAPSAGSLSAVPAMPVMPRPALGFTLPSAAAVSTFLMWASKRADGTSSLILANSSMAALAADEATLGSTTEARKATVDMIGLPALENGMG
uniref:Putative secreted protein n=1 Tax=Ixodes ricinus TaxID=34613 RepID=A0A6B0V5H1_IXORI